MSHSLSSFFSQEQVDGPFDRTIRNVATGSWQSGPETLYLLRKQPTRRRIERIRQQGCSIFASQLPRPAFLAGERSVTWIQVDDAIATLYHLATHFRQASTAKSIVITGSSGKTNTKDMIAHLLSHHFPNTEKTPGNWNGPLGMPLVLTRFKPEAPFWILEIGLDGRQQSIKKRAELAAPCVAVVTTVGMSHVAQLGSIEALAAHKSEVVQVLPADGLAVLNGDNPYCRQMASLTPANVLFFGLDEGNHVRASNIRQTTAGLSFNLHAAGQTVACKLPLIGRYHVHNALAAATVALWAGESLTQIAHSFTSYQAARQHGRITRTSWATVVDDGYNCNPLSLLAVIESLNELEGDSKWLVLGKMQPLEQFTKRYYDRLLDAFKKAKGLKVLFVGDDIKPLYDYVRKAIPCQWEQNELVAARLLRKRLARRRANHLIWLKSNQPKVFGPLRRELLGK